MFAFDRLASACLTAILAVVALGLTLTAAPAAAGTIVLDTSDNPFALGEDNQGAWNSDGTTSPTSSNYFTSSTRNAFFTFDLSAVTETVLGATLRLRRGFQPAGFTGVVVFFDVSTSAADLNTDPGPDVGIYNDLQSGTSYGTFTRAGGDSEDVLEFVLELAAIVDITAAQGGFFSIGVTLDDASGAAMFSGTGRSGTQQLVLATPEPGGFWLTGMGLLALGWTLRKRRPDLMEFTSSN